MLFGAATAYIRRVPPNNQICTSVTGSSLASGLVKDYYLGGCKCASEDAEWSTPPYSIGEFGPPNEFALNSGGTHWACYCTKPNTYASYPVNENTGIKGVRTALNEGNRREGGVIAECVTEAINKESRINHSEQKLLKNNYKSQKKLARKYTVTYDTLRNAKKVRS